MQGGVCLTSRLAVGAALSEVRTSGSSNPLSTRRAFAFQRTLPSSWSIFFQVSTHLAVIARPRRSARRPSSAVRNSQEQELQQLGIVELEHLQLQKTLRQQQCLSATRVAMCSWFLMRPTVLPSAKQRSKGSELCRRPWGPDRLLPKRAFEFE